MTILKWLGTLTGILGALLVATNVPLSGWGFVLFLVSSTAWAAAGLRSRDGALTSINLAFMATNVLGIYRWLLT